MCLCSGFTCMSIYFNTRKMTCGSASSDFPQAEGKSDSHDSVPLCRCQEPTTLFHKVDVHVYVCMLKRIRKCGSTVHYIVVVLFMYGFSIAALLFSMLVNQTRCLHPDKHSNSEPILGNNNVFFRVIYFCLPIV